MANIKVIHLELKGEHYYFGSPKAMFDAFDKSELGMSYNSFHSNVHLKPGVPYVNSRKGYTIRMGFLGQAKTNRNNHLSEIIRASRVENPFEVKPAPQEVVETIAPATVPYVEETPAAPVAVQESAPAPKRKRKGKDNPQQLTLF